MKAKVKGYRLEKVAQQHILKWIHDQGILMMATNTKCYPVNGKWLKLCGQPGWADLTGMLPSGRFLAIEVKSKVGKVSPLQQEWINRVNRAGGLALWARHVDDIKDIVLEAMK